MTLYNPKIGLVNDNVYTKFGKILSNPLKILSKNQFLTSIRGRNSAGKVRKMTLYNSNVDLVDDNVYAKSG